MAKRLDLKVIVGDKSESYRLRAPKGAEFTHDGAFREMSKFVNELVAATKQEFRVVRTGPSSFNVIHLG